MNTLHKTFAVLATCGILRAEDPADDITGLEKAAISFVSAYNEKDAEALSQLFNEDGEVVILEGEAPISGREAIKARYAAHFSLKAFSQVSIEVDSVRLVAPGLAIEDGTAHFTPLEEGKAPPRSIEYTAVLKKSKEGKWQIASSRSLRDVSGPAAKLADLAKVLNDEWSCVTDGGVRVDLAFGWDDFGKFLTGEMLVSASNVESHRGRIRIAWNAARKSIVSWMLDQGGGVTQCLPTYDTSEYLKAHDPAHDPTEYFEADDATNDPSFGQATDDFPSFDEALHQATDDFAPFDKALHQATDHQSSFDEAFDQSSHQSSLDPTVRQTWDRKTLDPTLCQTW